MIRPAFGLLCGLAATLLGTGAAAQDGRTAFDPSAPAADPQRKAEAEKLVEAIWSAALTTCGTTAVRRVDDRLLIELDEPKFTFVALRLPAAAKESGYEFRGVALASAKRWRWALQGPRTPRWSDWAPGDTTIVRDDNLTLDRGFTSVPDVVLKFDIVRKDGAWKAYAPISSLSYAIRPIDPTAPVAAPATSCPAQLAAK